jgi:hypothetical protein
MIGFWLMMNVVDANLDYYDEFCQSIDPKNKTIIKTVFVIAIALLNKDSFGFILIPPTHLHMAGFEQSRVWVRTI